MTQGREKARPPGVKNGLERVAVALDTADWPRFVALCELFGPRVGVLKVGLETFARWGPRAVETARRHAAGLFLDLKLHDIPNTVRGAVAAARDLGADYLTVHAGGGPAMLAAAAAAAGELRLLAVTLLTHLDSGQLEALDLPGQPAERVTRWAGLARAAGCAGVVCSPLEAAGLRQRHAAPFLLVTPGIRFAPRASAAAGEDQRRTATPGDALAAGADLLVVGRPLTAADDPEGALRRLARALEETP